MPRQINIVTPENISLTLELAGLGTRFGALLIDMLVQSIVTAIVAVGVGIMAAVMGAVDLESLGSLAPALLIAGIFLIWFGYFILFETLWNGQTPGKRVFGLRVVRDGGYPVNFLAVTTRNLIRLADFLPVSYAAGALSMFFSPQYKRLGDLVAGTVVVKEPEAQALSMFEATGAFPGLSVAATAQGARARHPLPEGVRNPYDLLSPEELTLLRRYATRRWQMTPDDGERLAYRLIVPLIGRLNITFTPGAPPRYADLADALVAAADAREAELEAIGLR